MRTICTCRLAIKITRTFLHTKFFQSTVFSSDLVSMYTAHDPLPARGECLSLKLVGVPVPFVL